MSLPLSYLVRSAAVGLSVMAAGTSVHAGQPGKLKPDVERGEQLYLENCWHCHGKRGLGDGPLAAAGPVAAPALAGRVPQDSDPWVTAIHRGKETMPAFGPVFDRHDARRVLVWLDELDPETGEGPGIEAKPDADEAKPDADEAKPDAGEAKPDAGEAKPDAGELPPAQLNAKDSPDGPDEPTPGTPTQDSPDD